MSIGERIRCLRKKQGLTQDDLAKKLGYKSRSTINKIELDINEITQSKIIEFAKVLGCSPVYLLGLTDDEQNTEADILKEGVYLVGSRISKRRKELGLSQAELGRRLGLNGSTIWRYETGEISAESIKLPVIESIAAILKVNPAWLIGKTEVMEPDSQVSPNEKNHNNIDKLKSNEIKHIKKYRALDADGKKIVDIILNNEYKRTEQSKLIQIPYIEKEFEKSKEMIDIDYYVSKVSAGGGELLNDDEKIVKIQIPLTNASRRADFAISVRGDSMEPKYYDGDLLLVRQQPAVDLGETGIFIVNNNGYVKKWAKPN